MDIKNQFIHHDYASEPSAESYELLTPELTEFTGAADIAEGLSNACRNVQPVCARYEI